MQRPYDKNLQNSWYKAYLVDTGVLETAEKGNGYNDKYDHAYNYCSTGQIYIENKTEAVDYAKFIINELKEHPEKQSYAIVSQTYLPIDMPVKISTVKNEMYYLKDVVYSSAVINGKIIKNFINPKPEITFHWNNNQKADIEKFLKKVNSGADINDDYIGAVEAGDICFDLVVREYNPGQLKLSTDCYVGNIDTGYGYSDKGMPYDFFCNVGYCWNIKKFKDMTYDDFTKFVEASLARQLRKLDGSIGTDNRFYDVLWLASKEPETKWNLEF